MYVPTVIDHPEDVGATVGVGKPAAEAMRIPRQRRN